LDNKEFILAMVGNEYYGFDVDYVESVNKIKKITSVYGEEDYVLGIINLRGNIIPVISLSRRILGLPGEITDKSKIVVAGKDKKNVMGILVDDVKEVIPVNIDEIDVLAMDVNDEMNKYITGLGKYEKRNIIISFLNMENLLRE